MTIVSVPAPRICAPIAIEEIREIDDLGLARRVLDDRLALGERRGHQQVLRAGHRHRVEHESRADAGASRARGCSRSRSGCRRPWPAARRRECSPDARRSRSRPATTRRPCRSAPAAGRARGSTHASCAPARTARRSRGSSTASTSTRILSSIVTLTPMRPSSSIMVVTSCRCGTLPTETGPSASSVAGENRQRGVLGAGDAHLAFERHAALDLQLVHDPRVRRRPGAAAGFLRASAPACSARGSRGPCARRACRRRADGAGACACPRTAGR